MRYLSYFIRSLETLITLGLFDKKLKPLVDIVLNPSEIAYRSSLCIFEEFTTKLELTGAQRIRETCAICQISIVEEELLESRVGEEVHPSFYFLRRILTLY